MVSESSYWSFSKLESGVMHSGDNMREKCNLEE